ncbi:MAG: DUF4836 family protein [Ginsengibacter sp.]|jgi:hypothetical protein
MKKNFGLSLALCLLIMLFASCNKSNEEGKMIPMDASFVASINMQSISKKISWEEIKQNAWFQKAYADSSTPEWRKKIMNDPKASGIDFEKNVTFFGVSKATGGEYLVAIGHIKNEKDFEQFNKNFEPSQNATKSGDVNLLMLKDQSVVGWKDNTFAYVMNSSFTPSDIYNWKDSASIDGPAAPVESSASISAYCASLFSLKSDSSLTKNNKFSNLLKDKGDLYFWQNTEAAMKNNPALGMVSMLKLDAILKNSFSAMTVNFDNGKVEIDQKQYMGKELSDYMKKYKGTKINKDMISNIPSQNVLGIFASNFKPGAIEEFIKLMGADGIANMFLQQAGFNLSDLSKANNGNMVIALTDLQMKPNTLKDIKDSTGKDMNVMIPDMKISLIMGVKDEPSFQKIMNAGKKMLSQMPNDTTLNMVLNDKYFVVSNSGSFATQYLAANTKNKFDFIDKIDGQSIAAFADLHKIFTILSSQQTNNQERKAMIDQNLKFWNYITIKAGDMDGDAITGETEINMMDEKTNSLKSLNNYVNEMYQINAAKMQRNGAKKKLDSLLTPPPIDTVPVK